MSTNVDVHYIPGYPEPVPVDAVVALEDGSSITTDMVDPGAPTWYHFTVEGDTPVVITFIGPDGGYKLMPYKKSEDEKGGTSNAHEEKVGEATHFTFNEPGPYEIFFAVYSQDPDTLPIRGYTIEMATGNGN